MTWNNINVIPKVFWLYNLCYSFTSRKTQLLSVNKGLIHQQSKLLYKELQGMSRSVVNRNGISYAPNPPIPKCKKNEQSNKLKTYLCRLVAKVRRYTGLRLSSFNYQCNNQLNKQSVLPARWTDHHCTTGSLTVISRCCGSTPQHQHTRLSTIQVVFFSQ